ncbi:glycosyltransferase family 4 protein [Methanomethylovorans hollandica]|uniref:glycosyltransferase family 4 protein n=1 Tax=Methanomethylovorans hollandica TaxID=101192 RepID=UPI0012E9AC96|nr:glycosyltransferase family 4 protein [Methanomethylovorans hollandica]
MKILRVISDLYPYVVGGIGIHAHEMSKRQVIFGHSVDVYTTSLGSKSSIESATNYNVYQFKPLVKLLGNPINLRMFKSLYKNRYNYDIIHAHGHLYFSTILCSVIRTIGSSPLVITNHGLRSQTAPKWFQSLYNSTVAKLIFRSADRIICYTQEEKDIIIKMGVFSTKISLVHNGIDTDLFIPPENAPLNQQKLLWIGRYVKGKGVDYLVDALNILKSDYPKIILTMVGTGPDKDKIIRKIHNYGLENSIILKDFIPNSEIVQLYHQSSIFVLPSLEEGVPRTILEAMSCGVPIVCSRLPQLVDIVEGSGFLVPTKDPQSLADSISTILSDPQLAANMGNHGRQQVLNGYSWLDTVKKTISLYEELI